MNTKSICFIASLFILLLPACNQDTTKKAKNCPDKTFLKTGDILSLDLGKLEVLKIQTDSLSPVNKIKSETEHHYILICLKTLSLEAEDGISSVNFVLTDANGSSYKEPGAWGKIELMGNSSDFEATDGGMIMIYEANKAVNLFFEVPLEVSADKLRLSYKAIDLDEDESSKE